MQLTDRSAASLHADIAAGRLDPRDLVAASYDRIEQLNGCLNALHALRPREEALAEAARSSRFGPLAGLPLAVKDLANAAGFRTTYGSTLHASGPVAAQDDIFVARLRAAGAIVIGKSNTPEFGLGSHSYNRVHGTTRNPWDPARAAGGSSGGASVALATGMVALADGSDMMGSLRNPAGWTNTYGLRPTWRLVPSEPGGDTFLHQLSTMGPMGRTPQDVELMLRVMAGPDPRQPNCATLAPAPRPRRLAWLGDWGGAWPMDAGVLATCEAALPSFEALECTVETVEPPFSAEALWEAWITLRSWNIAAELADDHADAARRAELKPEAIWEIERGLALSALDVHRASVVRSQWYATAAELFERYDAFLLPTAQIWPFPAEWHWPATIAGQSMDTYHRWMEVTIPASLAGLPALAIPAGFGAEGLPMGLQVIGPRGSDLGLLDLGKGWHASLPWAGQRPPICGP